jgi:3-oxoacyl-[acyl-carrier-protein] synthase-1
MSRAVYLSGFGHQSAGGATMTAVADAICAGQSGCGTRNVAGQAWPYYAMETHDLDWSHRSEKVVRAVANEVRTGLAIADQEWQRAGLFIGSSCYQIGEIEQDQHRTGNKQRPLVADFSRQVAGWLGIDTQPWCFATACTSSLSALDAATTMIRSGQITHALVLGLELDNDTSVAGFAALNLLSGSGCRPLDVTRDGLVLGEAVGALWLSAEPCQGAWDNWRVAGLSAALDHYSATGPNPDGSVIARTMSQALKQAQREPTEIELIKLHAAGSPSIDAIEAKALRDVFGEKLPPLVSFKAYLGHTLGASGAVELSALVACLHRGIIPTTAGFDSIDPAIGMMPTTTTLHVHVGTVLFNMIGFGGSIVSLVLERAT